MSVPGSFDGSGIAISLTTRGKLIKIRIYSRGGEKKKEKKKKPPLHVLLFIVGRLVTSVARDACNVICRGSLFPDSEQSPAVYLRDDPLFGSLQLQQHSELRAPTAERAAFYLDAAVAGRQREDGDAHMLYTLHVYQYSVAGKGGGERNPPFSPPSLPSALSVSASSGFETSGFAEAEINPRNRVVPRIRRDVQFVGSQGNGTIEESKS